MSSTRQRLISELSVIAREHPRVKVLMVIIVPVGAFVAFFVLPLLTIVGYSFLERGPYGVLIVHPTIENYVRAFNWFYVELIFFTVRISLETVLIALFVGYLPALYIGRQTGAWKAFLMFLIVIPAWTSYIIRVFSWLLMLSDYGFLNWILTSLNIVPEPLRLAHTEFAVMVGFVHVFLPFMILPIQASVSSLNPRLVESAKVLGAGIFKSFFEVTLPLTRSGIGAGCILVFLLTLGGLITPAVLGGPSDAMIAQIISSQFLGVIDWPFASALSLIFLLLILACVGVFNRFLKLDRMFGGL